MQVKWINLFVFSLKGTGGEN